MQSEQEATHIVENQDSPADSADVLLLLILHALRSNVAHRMQDAEYFRPLKKKGDMVLVHWWYYPDSYDEWVPASEVRSPPKLLLASFRN